MPTTAENAEYGFHHQWPMGYRVMDGRTVGRTDWHEIQKQDFFSMFRDLQFGPQFKFRLMLRFDRVVYFDINCFKLRPWSELSICKAD